MLGLDDAYVIANKQCSASHGVVVTINTIFINFIFGFGHPVISWLAPISASWQRELLCFISLPKTTSQGTNKTYIMVCPRCAEHILHFEQSVRQSRLYRDHFYRREDEEDGEESSF